MPQAIYTTGTSSTSHTYGNVAAFIKNRILSFFPQDFFTYTYISSKIAFKDIKEVLGNGDAEFRKRRYPFMVINPRFSNIENDRFGYDIPLTKNMDNIEVGIRRNTLHPIIRDYQHRCELRYKLNRDRLEFEIEIRVGTVKQQLDLFKNIQNQMVWDRPHTTNVSLESMIPRSMIEYIGKMAQIDINMNDTTNIPIIMRHLNAHSAYPITYKINNSTSIESFFMYYQTRLLMTFTDLQISDGTKKNMADDFYPITFRVVTEFNLPGMYALLGNNDGKFRGMKFDTIVNCGDNNTDMIPMYTITNLYDRYTTDPHDGFTFYTSTIIHTDETKDLEDDFVKLDDIIEPQHMKILNNFIRDGIPLNSIFRMKLLKDDMELPYDEDTEKFPDALTWKIDWKKRQVNIYRSDKYATYRIIVYANMVSLNEKLIEMHYQNQQDRPSINI